MTEDSKPVSSQEDYQDIVEEGLHDLDSKWVEHQERAHSAQKTFELKYERQLLVLLAVLTFLSVVVYFSSLWKVDGSRVSDGSGKLSSDVAEIVGTVKEIESELEDAPSELDLLRKIVERNHLAVSAAGVPPTPEEIEEVVQAALQHGFTPDELEQRLEFVPGAGVRLRISDG